MSPVHSNLAEIMRHCRDKLAVLRTRHEELTRKLNEQDEYLRKLYERCDRLCRNTPRYISDDGGGG
jgi:predicted nuclease with TOPRIM domain